MAPLYSTPTTAAPALPDSLAKLRFAPAPETPAAIRAYFLAHFPDEELPGPFLEVLSQCYLLGVAAYFTGHGQRPRCTLDNVMATVTYPHVGHVLRMLQTEPGCAGWVLHLQDTLARHAVNQVRAVMAFIEVVLPHVQPAPATMHLVHGHIRAFA